MLKKSKWQKSNAAHKGLENRYTRKFDREKKPSWDTVTKMFYHSQVRTLQRQEKKVLDSKRKRAVYRSVEEKITPAFCHSRPKPLKSDDFERNAYGMIKGSYTPDGFFEPD